MTRMSVREMVEANDPTAQWSAYYSVLVNAVPGLKGNASYVFQFTNPERNADWIDPNAGGPAVFIDSRPVTGPFHTPSDQRVSDNYITFLQAIKTEGEDPILKRAIDNFYTAEAQGLTMTMDGDLQKDWDKWKVGTTNPISVEITSSTRIDNQWNVVASGDINVLGFVISGSGNVLDKKIIDEKYAFKLRFEAMKQYTMNRGRNWFNGGLLEVYKNANFIAEYYTKKTFFGPEGLLNLIPTSAVVGYKPSFSITMSKSNYEEFKLDLEGQGEISIGPFKLNANAKFNKTDINEQKETAEIFYEGTADQPVLVGIFSVSHVEK